MKSTFLTLVVVCSLVIAGIGGTLATWADSETSFDNYIATGSLDLKVNGADDLPWGTGVPTKVELDDMVPCKFYGPFEIELWNAGQHDPENGEIAKAYMHLRDLECSNVLPKVHPVTGATTGYPDPSTGLPWSGDLKPEPELVAEYGGMVSIHEVPGIGVEGDDCSMGTHVEMVITTTDVDPTTNSFADILVGPDGRVMRDKLGKWECQEIYLFDLVPCVPRTIYLWFHLQQESEEDFGFDLVPDPPFVTPDYNDNNFAADDADYDAKLLHWQKFNDWPSWAMMKDMGEFDLEFDLWLVDPPA